MCNQKKIKYKGEISMSSMNLVARADSEIRFGKIIGGMFVTGEYGPNQIFEVNMYPIFTDAEGNEKVLMNSMYKKKFVTSDINVMTEKINEVIAAAESQIIRDYIKVTRIKNIELSVIQNSMSYEILYNDAKYMTICTEVERKGYSVCYFASRRAPKYIETKDLVRLTRSNVALIYFF